MILESGDVLFPDSLDITNEVFIDVHPLIRIYKLILEEKYHVTKQIENDDGFIFHLNKKPDDYMAIIYLRYSDA